jgi:hypothetical protein
MRRSPHNVGRTASRRAATRVGRSRVSRWPARAAKPATQSKNTPALWSAGVRVLLTLLALLSSLASMRAAEEKVPTQYSEEQVKAAILVGFAKTTEWPPGTFKEGTKTLVIGIFGRDTLGDDATRPFTAPGPGTSLSGQTVQFKVIAEEEGVRGCHVLFIPRQERRRAREILDWVKGAPVLTVGETDDFLDQEGMVSLVPKDGKMKFEINLNAAKAANLKIPAKVLGAALKVRGKYD